MHDLTQRRSRQKRSRPVGTLLIGTWLAVSGVAGSQPGSYPGGADAGARPSMGYPPQPPPQQQQQRPPQDPRQQQQQQQLPGQQQTSSAHPYRGPGSPAQQQQQQQPPPQQPPYGSQPQYGASSASPYSGQTGYSQRQPLMPAQGQQQQQPPPSQMQQQQYGGAYSAYGSAAGYSGGPQAPYGRPTPPQQPPPQQEGAGFFSRIASRFKGDAGGYPGLQPAVSQYGRPGGAGGGGGGGGMGGQQRAPASYQWPPSGSGQQQQQGLGASAGALQPMGPARGPIAQQAVGGQYRPPPQQRPAYGGAPQQQQQQQQQGEGMGIWSRIKDKVFQGDGQESQQGPPSFRPKGATLSKRHTASQGGAGPGYNANGYGMPYPGYGGGPGMMGGMPADVGGGVGVDGGSIPQGPGKPEALSVDGSVVLLLKPHDLERKKRKFRADGDAKLQVIANFDHTLTRFSMADGRPTLRTTEALELNSQGMLPEAAKKVRYLRSEFKRRMEAEGKDMALPERVRALEEHLRKVYATVTQEGGMHMSSIGPAIDPQLPAIPLREGCNDMIGALAYRGIPLVTYCAGYGNVAMEVLKRGAPKMLGPSGTWNPGVRLISNFFRPDDTMTIAGMFDTVPLIHEANKNGQTIADFLKGAQMDGQTLASRSNVILLGSDVSDLALASGLPGQQHDVLSVGFMRMEADFLEKLPRFANAFDAVVFGDGDMAFVNEVLHEITS